jgi:hypothetical protein
MEQLNLFEKHLTIAELADQWSLSEDAVRRLFEHEPGVVVITSPPKKYRRSYRTFRIPETVAARVYRRMQIAA